MLSIFDFAREMTTLSIAVRMIAAFLCGGLIGLEREFKRRTAGFRTHILIALGACIAILTNLYLYQAMHLYTDISRLGAQVIAGIGFIGAGTIIVTKRRRVKGLTTAAGLWTAAIIGLACGAGFLECAILATAMVLLAEMLLVRLEYALNTKADDAPWRRSCVCFVRKSLPFRIWRSRAVPEKKMFLASAPCSPLRRPEKSWTKSSRKA